MDKRIFVQKRKDYRQEEERLKNALNAEYSLDLDNIDIYIVYDIYNIE